MKILKNLGSVVSSITDVSEDRGMTSGFTLLFDKGDVCLDDPTKYYTSEIRYMCPTMGEGKHQDSWPYLVQPREACHIVFEWLSDNACSQCLHGQVRETYGTCIDGVANVTLALPTTSTGSRASNTFECLIPAEDDELLDVESNGLWRPMRISKDTRVSSREVKYAFAYSDTRPCGLI
jgi:hypothetical protein